MPKIRTRRRTSATKSNISFFFWRCFDSAISSSSPKTLRAVLGAEFVPAASAALLSASPGNTVLSLLSPMCVNSFAFIFSAERPCCFCSFALSLRAIRWFHSLLVLRGPRLGGPRLGGSERVLISGLLSTSAGVWLSVLAIINSISLCEDDLRTIRRRGTASCVGTAFSLSRFSPSIVPRALCFAADGAASASASHILSSVMYIAEETVDDPPLAVLLYFDLASGASWLSR
mmetsp:Transcript_20391/g.46744  ORF Transcript_20391/g.46744 Transcript_20391/m.46744 type:complete len:231 (-) Transcript_20391:541-1233(-)